MILKQLLNILTIRKKQFCIYDTDAAVLYFLQYLIFYLWLHWLFLHQGLRKGDLYTLSKESALTSHMFVETQILIKKVSAFVQKLLNFENPFSIP